MVSFLELKVPFKMGGRTITVVVDLDCLGNTDQGDLDELSQGHWVSDICAGIRALMHVIIILSDKALWGQAEFC